MHRQSLKDSFNFLLLLNTCISTSLAESSVLLRKSRNRRQYHAVELTIFYIYLHLILYYNNLAITFVTCSVDFVQHFPRIYNNCKIAREKLTRSPLRHTELSFFLKVLLKLVSISSLFFLQLVIIICMHVPLTNI